jgi:hypothetical protein
MGNKLLFHRCTHTIKYIDSFPLDKNNIPQELDIIP